MGKMREEQALKELKLPAKEVLMVGDCPRETLPEQRKLGCPTS